MSKIGFIGLGHMGLPMLKNLLAAHHEVIVHDLCEHAVYSAVEMGAQAAKSFADFENVNFLFTMLQTGDQVSSVCLGEKGLFNVISHNTLYIDSSSIDVVTSRQLHSIAQSRGIPMLDAPVSGGVIGAEAATLTFMIGGEASYYDKAVPIFNCLGKKVIHAGAPGNGQAAKICNNMILGISMIAVSEGFVLAKKLGLEPKKFFEIANNASSQCWSLSKYCPMPGVLEDVPSSKGFVAGFTANMMLKDLKLSQDAALHVDATTPLGAQATALYHLLANEGQGDEDFSAIIKLLAGNLEL